MQQQWRKFSLDDLHEAFIRYENQNTVSKQDKLAVMKFLNFIQINDDSYEQEETT